MAGPLVPTTGLTSIAVDCGLKTTPGPMTVTVSTNRGLDTMAITIGSACYQPVDGENPARDE